ncbi:MAG: hypothetical protein ABI315_04155 [Bacteroidia bacterium]
MFNKNKNSFFAFVLFYIPFTVVAQQLNYTLNRDYLQSIDSYYNNSDQSFQTFVKPYRYVDILKIADSSIFFNNSGSWQKLTNNKKKLLDFKCYPLLIGNAGFEEINKTPQLDLGIGLNLLANIGSKFSFNIKALTGKAIFSEYTNSLIGKTNVIPGIGFKYFNNGSSLPFSYQYYSGYVSYSPNKIINLQLGKDKNFFGDGYRSLFLSDVAAPYPYFKITTNIWHLTYVNLFTQFKDVIPSSGLKKDVLNKYATFHYLGWNVTKRINIGLFESIVWQGSDSNRHRGYDINYLNPVLFFRPIEYSLGSSDNACLGFSFKIKMFNKQQLYGQVLLDEFLLKEMIARNGWWANKYAFQAGFKSFDITTIKRLNFQTEFNYARPYTYTHGSVQQNYSHLNQPLAHPLGANFMESATFINYTYKRLFFEFKNVYAIFGEDNNGINYGKNIFISYVNRPKEYGNYTTQGIRSTLITTSLRAAYMIYVPMNLKLELGVLNRALWVPKEHTSLSPYIFIGLHTDLGNLYDDFF